MPLFCIAEDLNERTVMGFRDQCEARELPVVLVDPLDDWEAANPGTGDAVWRCSDSVVARTVEVALARDGVLLPWVSAARARVAIDHAPEALRSIGFPVRPAVRLTRPKKRDRLRAQVERLGGFPVTVLAGGVDGYPIPIAGPTELFSIVDYLHWCGDALYLLGGNAWHARREVYVCGGHAIGGVDTWTFSRWRRRTRPGPDDELAVAAAEALGLRFARVVLSWDAAQRPHIVDGGFPAQLNDDVVEPWCKAVVHWLASEGLR